MEQTVQPWKRKLLVVCSLCINLGLLCYFKYTNFFYEMLAPLWHGQFEPLDIFLPVGISFFTFQSLSYTIDVYRRDLKPLTNLLDYAFLCVLLSAVGGRAYCPCTRLYPANPSALVCII